MQTTITPFDSTLGKALTVIGLPIAGGSIAHLWGRFRRRLALLRWSAQYQAMAFATHDFGWGKIDILYNGVATQNLHIATVRLQNVSSRDLENLTINIRTNNDSTILRSGGQLVGESNGFVFANDYATIVAKASKQQLTPDEISFWFPRADFAVPVLNRNAIAEFRMLISRSDYSTPSVTLGCTHLGVRVLHEPPEEKAFGVARGRAQLTGVVATLIIASLIVRLQLPVWLAIGLAWLSGALVLLVGAYIVRGFQKLARLAE